MRVVRLSNTSRQTGFNAYIVQYKDKLWTLCSSEVKDNILIKERNDIILEHKDFLELKYQKLKDLFDTNYYLFYNTLLSLKSECADSIKYYNNLKYKLPAIRDSLVAVKKAQLQAKADKAYREWYNTLPASTKKAADVISITKSTLDFPNSVGGCDYVLYYINKSTKTIKYLYWYGYVYNAVNDIVHCEIRNQSYFSGKETGPIACGEKGGGYWDCIIYNHSANRLKLNNIMIEYMDGSLVSIAGADIVKLLEEPFIDINVNSYEIRNLVISDTECQNKIDIWQERLSNLEKRKFHPGLKEKYLNDNSYNKIWLHLMGEESKINSLQHETKKARQELEEFNKFINFEIHTITNTDCSYSNSGYNSTNMYDSKNKNNPFVTFGIEGSFEYLQSFSTGWGISMRLGQFNALVNATVGLKYQYTGYKKKVQYFYGEGIHDYIYHGGNADYKHMVHQIIIPITINCNIVRNSNYSYYLGIGYEHGFLLSESRRFNNPSYDFQEEDFYRSGELKNILNLSIPSRTIVFQIGTSGRHWDCNAYYKLYVNKSKYTKSDAGAIGMAFTYYF